MAEREDKQAVREIMQQDHDLGMNHLGKTAVQVLTQFLTQRLRELPLDV